MLRQDIWSLTKLFVVYKLVLLGLQLLVVAPFDTSTTLILPSVWSPESRWNIVAKLIQRLVIWDSVFFTQIAARGIVFEHEWAFGSAWPLLIRAVTGGNTGLDLAWYGLSSILLSITSHYLATIVLYLLTEQLGRRIKAPPSFARLTASLYVLSPAGVFLVAGYSESTFALLSFLGLYFREKGAVVTAGVMFALSCSIRSNGLLWGVVFLIDLVSEVRRSSGTRLARVVAILTGGAAIGAVWAGIQLYPALLYCPGRPWCGNTIPSVFSYVQAKYWNVGLFSYWTPNNVPNFLFGLPTYYLIVKSARPLLWRDAQALPIVANQVLLGLLTLFVFNSQIITRVGSCLPGLYWYTALLLQSTNLEEVELGKRITTYFLAWGICQAILFAAFMPPA